MSISFELGALNKFFNKVKKMPSKTDAVMEQVVKEYAEKLLQETLRAASGRPGPNVVTGQYVSNMYVRVANRFEIAVGNKSPQAYRLEYGFVGTDSIGRMYNQPPYPHFRPAKAKIEPQFRKAVRSAPLRAWRSM